MRSTLLFSGLLLSSLLCTGANAADSAQDVPMREIEATAFDAQRGAIVEGFVEGGRYAEIDAEQKTKVLAALDNMGTILGPGVAIDQLSPDKKVALYNEQEIVNTILTDAQETSREVCKRNRTVNSRLKNSECHTVAEWERRRERARELAEKNKRYVTKPAGG